MEPHEQQLLSELMNKRLYVNQGSYRKNHQVAEDVTQVDILSQDMNFLTISPVGDRLSGTVISMSTLNIKNARGSITISGEDSLKNEVMVEFQLV
ncbi:MAG: hypothetical protein UT34_C0001G0283 [candidate division WS6 bacterium GW2011_GWF2_39_15]|uniref:Uncharacterized protein n=1 Tax=candidate division WS6 bacterium GW2011_GWF2_39_15 TaxID=1619100 RepID=A0A0G0MSX4_9BACT|nr:MAG: hypothetical protein UT34_C0001G0283 [candidate division WS6 bacterium GW2011_GWF2_39_15]